MPNDEKDLNYDKPVEPKGIDTSTGDARKEREEALKKTPLVKQDLGKTEALRASVGRYGATSLTSQSKGYYDSIDDKAYREALYQEIDLGQAIPDERERKKFLMEHGSHRINPIDPNKYRITFQSDLQDIFEYKQKGYHTAVKKFIDQLDEDQGMVAEGFNNLAKLLGSTVINTTGSFIPTIYGLGAAVVEGDFSRFWDNDVARAWDDALDWWDTKFTVYGGSDIWNYNTATGQFEQKDFFARMWHDPMKVVNADIIPAASFVASIVLSEIAASALTMPTLGASQVRVANQIGRYMKGPNLLKQIFSSSYKVSRGLQALKAPSVISEAAKIERITQRLNKGIGTGMTILRSTAYESGIIARGTKDRLLNDFRIQHHIDNGGQVDANGNPVGPMIEPTEQELTDYMKWADAAGDTAYLMNVPLVAASNFIQFGKLFNKNWQHLSKANRFTQGKIPKPDAITKGTATFERAVAGDVNKWVKGLGYLGAVVKPTVTEGFEEYAQGVIEHGLTNYYLSNKTEESLRSQMGYIEAFSKASKHFVSTTEGRDAITIGALMGFLGMRLPVKTEGGKVQFDLKSVIPFSKSDAYGGAMQEIRDLNARMETARQTVQKINDNIDTQNVVVKNNFNSFYRHQQIQTNLDNAVENNNILDFKNNEGDLFYDFVKTKHDNGIHEVFEQDLDAMEEMDNDEFNKHYGIEGEIEYSEQEQKEVVDKLRKRTKDIVESLEEVDTILEAKPGMLDRAYDNLFKNKKQREDERLKRIYRGVFRDQLQYLHAVGKNTDERIEALTNELQGLDISKETVGTYLSKLARLSDSSVALTGLNIEDKAEDSADFDITLDMQDNTDKVLASILKDWKETDPLDYNRNADKVKDKIRDILKLRRRRAAAARMYKAMFTPKGTKAFLKYIDAIEEASLKKMLELAEQRQLERTNEAKNPNQLDEIEKDSKSLFGNADNVTEAQEKAVVKGILEYKKKLKQFAQLEENQEPLSYEEQERELLALLDKHPALFKLLRDRLVDAGHLIFNDLSTVAELERANELSDDNVIPLILQELENINKEYDNIKSSKQENSTNPNPNSPQFDEDGNDSKDEDTDKLLKHNFENAYEGGVTVTEHGIMVITHDKQLVKGEDGKYTPKYENTPNSKKAKPVTHPSKNNEQDVQAKVNTALINDPDFLNNDDIKGKKIKVFYRISNVEYNYQDGQLRNIEDVVIEIVYLNPKTNKEHILGVVPAFKEGMPEHLRALREAVVERHITMEELGDQVVEKDSVRDLNDSKEELLAKKKSLEELEEKIKEEQTTTTEEKIETERPNVILPIGTSGSGKSTFIKSLPQENLVVISPDEMRKEFTGDINDKSKDAEIYKEAAKRAVEAIKEGKQVVFDTTNLTKEKRRPFIEAIKKAIPDATIQYKLMPLDPELAKQRIKNQLERGEDRAAVSDETIDRHAASYAQMLEDIKSEDISEYQEKQITKEVDSKLIKELQKEYDALLKETNLDSIEAIDEKIQELSEKIQEQLQDFDTDLSITKRNEKIFREVRKYNQMKEATSRQKKAKEDKLQELIKEFGQEEIDRVNAIDNNFDDIIAALIQGSKVNPKFNVFFDPETELHKKCD
jgi:predicted kinase